ncbi:hypothetical protein MPLB_1510063 [Mesorhizobium sp. ORS 3324]|nr:hypothetical protein MPLB_1510063 [Mesorhizobium sp. ORS 3324]
MQESRFRLPGSLRNTWTGQCFITDFSLKSSRFYFVLLTVMVFLHFAFSTDVISYAMFVAAPFGSCAR